ncbi:MAG: hypothetical protein ACE5EA_08200 [Nitrospirota bacterium]
MEKDDNKEQSVMKNQRNNKDRRDESIERRDAERRIKNRRIKERREITRRKEFCPACGEKLTSTLYCQRCKARIVRIR